MIDSGFEPYLSAMSISEMAIKHGIGKLNFGWMDDANGLDDLEIGVLPYTESHAERMFGLPLHLKDPFDRQIIAQYLAEGVPIVTPDRLFRSYAGVSKSSVEFTAAPPKAWARR